MNKQSKNNIKITNTMQKVAVEILSEVEVLLMTSDKTIKCDDLCKLFTKYKELYNLCDDPFTQTICTSQDCAKHSTEYNRQKMIEKYGYYEE